MNPYLTRAIASGAGYFRVSDSQPTQYFMHLRYVRDRTQFYLSQLSIVDSRTAGFGNLSVHAFEIITIVIKFL